MGKDLIKHIEAAYQETQRRQRRAWRPGIDTPTNAEWWLADDKQNIQSNVRVEELELVRRRYLTEERKARLTFLIEDAEIKKETAQLD